MSCMLLTSRSSGKRASRDAQGDETHGKPRVAFDQRSQDLAFGSFGRAKHEGIDAQRSLVARFSCRMRGRGGGFAEGFVLGKVGTDAAPPIDGTPVAAADARGTHHLFQGSQ